MSNQKPKKVKASHHARHIKDATDYADYGASFNAYLEAFANNDLAGVESHGEIIAESALIGISTIGKFMASGAEFERTENSSIGILLTLLSEIGANARLHATDAAFMKSRGQK
jgi:hypothetical protein